MNKYLKALPFVLLSALVPFFFYSQPNLAQSVIVLSVSGLCGFLYYLDSKQQPDYKQQFAKELDVLMKHSKETREMIVKSQLQDVTKKVSNFVF